MQGKIPREEYLNKDFDYTKLTKQELRQIMSENNVQEIPPLTSLKSVILDAYKATIHDKIDELKGNFSNENIFQSPKPVKVEIKNSKEVEKTPSKNVEETNKAAQKEENSSFVANSSKIFKEPVIRLKNGFDGSNTSGVYNHSTVSEMDTVKANAPESFSFVKTTNPIPQAQIEKTAPAKKSRIFKKRYIFLLILISFIFYLKFICPYCTGRESVCIPVPQNSTVKNGKLVCSQGFKLSHGIINICVPDVSRLTNIQRRVHSIIKVLEYMKGGEEYGSIKSRKMRPEDLCSDQSVLELLKKSEMVIFDGEFIEAKNKRVSLRIICKFYAFKIFKFTLGILVLVFSVKIWLRRRRKIAQMRSQAHVLTKDVNDLLSRQLLMSAKSTLFKPYIYEQQIMEYLEIKPDLWKFIRENLDASSNILAERDEFGKERIQWVGPVSQRGDSGDFTQFD